MTHHFTPGDGRALDPELGVLRRMLRRFSDELLQHYDALRRDGPDASVQARRTLEDLRHCLRLALFMEAEIEERDATEGTAPGGAALDLDAARTSIGGRLDRLRAAHGATGLSGQSDAT